MSVWTKLFMAVKGGVNETAEGIADAQALRVMDQEIREAEKALAKAQTDLAGLMGKRRLSQKRRDEFAEKLSRDEQVVIRAIEQGREDLAEELAGRMVTIEAEFNKEEAGLAQLQASEQQLKQVISTTKNKLDMLKCEVETVKVTESVQKAQSAIASQSAGVQSRMGDASSSLMRIKERQAAHAAQMEASQELDAITDGSDLDRRLAEAGVAEGASTASTMLARIRAQSSKSISSTSVPSIEGPRD